MVITKGIVLNYFIKILYKIVCLFIAVAIILMYIFYGHDICQCIGIYPRLGMAIDITYIRIPNIFNLKLDSTLPNRRTVVNNILRIKKKKMKICLPTPIQGHIIIKTYVLYPRVVALANIILFYTKPPLNTQHNVAQSLNTPRLNILLFSRPHTRLPTSQ